MLKKFIYLICLICSVAAVSACSDSKDDYTPRAGMPEKEAAGEYFGSFTRVTKGLDDAVTATGSVTITPASGQNTANITFSCPELGVDVTRIFNITFSNDGFAFSNHLSDDTDTKTSAIAGRIDGQNNMVTKFTLQQRDGRKTVQYDYDFTGQK